MASRKTKTITINYGIRQTKHLKTKTTVLRIKYPPADVPCFVEFLVKLDVFLLDSEHIDAAQAMYCLVKKKKKQNKKH